MNPPDRLGEASVALSQLIALFPDLAIACAVHDTESRDGRGNTVMTFHLPDWSVAQYERRTYREGVVDELGVAFTLDPGRPAQIVATLEMFRAIAASCDRISKQCRDVIKRVEAEAKTRREERG